VKFGKRERQSNVNQNHCRKQTSQDKKRLIKQKRNRKKGERKKEERKKEESTECSTLI